MARNIAASSTQTKARSSDILDASAPVLDGTTLYYRTLDGLSSTGVDAPASGHTQNNEFSNVPVVVDGDYVYYVLQGVYTRTPSAGGAPEAVQMLSALGLLGCKVASSANRHTQPHC